MTGFDYIVLLIAGAAAIGGFARGFVQEIISLAAWLLAIVAIRMFHVPATELLAGYIGQGISTAVLAFALLLLVPYVLLRAIARRAGTASRKSLLGPVDRLLGFGFGLIKGVLIVIISFSLVVLGYDTIWGAEGRPSWIVTARSYNLVDAGSRGMMEILAERRQSLLDQEDATNPQGAGS